MDARASLRLGIVGGLGALAGADLLNRLVQVTPVRSEGDHREILFEQRPLREPVSPADPDYQPAHRKFYVYDTLARMERNGCGAALLPCFVTHTFLNELREELGLRLVSMTDAIRNHVAALPRPPRNIGVLTSPYVRKSGLFDGLFDGGIKVLYPQRATEAAMLEAVYGADGFKTGRRDARVTEPVIRALEELSGMGADLVVPGLTELPLLIEQLTGAAGIPVLNTATLYAEHALALTGAAARRPFKVGVVGGVGPAATVDFLSKLVAGTDARRDQDHLKVLVEQNPQIPDRTENLLGGGTDPSIALYSTCKKLERGGADIIAIPCNTAHAYLDRIQRHLDIPIVSILTVTADHIRAAFPAVRKVGILATSGTIQSGLYQEALEAAGLLPVVPDEAHQALVMEAIYGPQGVKAGRISGLCREQIVKAIEHLKAAGAEAAILGCTELPLIAPEPGSAAIGQLIDPTQVLAAKCASLAQAAEHGPHSREV
ncbi:aspartate/glutamate racemase family protein [Leisingera thetidis]|uniref:aspartate/glutamate racemase family protein n=1 Tax=Leisingera thetidis TaxID=2930199 RepID=UPI0021F7C683|nr:amino acid racemase [Leisingera thetidis]